MPLTTEQLRGWKEIAAYLKASERSVKRWEKTRGLPVRRLPGTSRDAVFAVPDEIEAWVRAGSTEPGSYAENGAIVASGEASCKPDDGPWLRARLRTVLVALGIVGALVAVSAGVYYGHRAARTPPSTRLVSAPGGARAVQKGRPGPTAIVLHVQTASSAARVSIVDGGCGAVALSGHPFVDLCPRLVGDGLLLDVFKRGEGPKAEKVVTLRLDPDSQVRVPGQVSFDVEWIDTTTVPPAPSH